MAKKVTQYQNEQQVLASVQHTTYSGPLPTPQDLAGYKNVLPDAPERIVSMAEDEQEYRHKLNNKVVHYGIVESIIGLILAFIIVVLFLGAIIYLAMNNHDWIAGVLAGIIAALAAIFYLKKSPTSK